MYVQPVSCPPNKQTEDFKRKYSFLIFIFVSLLYLRILSRNQILCIFLFTACVDDAFHCSEEKKCIPDEWHCDGIDDCDGEDEKDCEGYYQS